MKTSYLDLKWDFIKRKKTHNNKLFYGSAVSCVSHKMLWPCFSSGPMSFISQWAENLVTEGTTNICHFSSSSPGQQGSSSSVYLKAFWRRTFWEVKARKAEVLIIILLLWLQGPGVCFRMYQWCLSAVKKACRQWKVILLCTRPTCLSSADSQLKPFLYATPYKV